MNTKNKVEKEVSHLAALTSRQVRWARKVFALGKKRSIDIARRLKISKTAASLMLHKKTYKNVK